MRSVESTSAAVASAVVVAVCALAPAQIDRFGIPTPASRPYTIVAGADGNLWFTESLGDKIARIAPDGHITEVPLDSGAGPYGICVGADGAVWFTERFANRIGRLDANGRLSHWNIPTANSQPWEIILGPDGNCWFTEEDVNQIGRITPQGQITEFPTGSCCFPTGICAGPDGNIWFTLEIGDQIGRMTPAGAVTLFQIDRVQVLPWDIIAGPDGNLWFTELAGLAIGRITPDGEITEFPVEGEFSGIAGIAAGPDGNLWFTRNDTHRIGVMDTNGNVLRTFTSPGERPLGITSGPDGNVWFTIADGNAIGRVATARPGRVYALSLEAGFSPQVREGHLGDVMQWTFMGPGQHGVADLSGLRLFDTGPRGFVSYASLPLRAAATFVYRDTAGGGRRGAIRVAPDAPASGAMNEPFEVTWSLTSPPAGLVFDVQIREPGSNEWIFWQEGVAVLSATYTPSGAGEYRFRSRIRNLSGERATLYSPAAAVRVQ